MANLSLQKQVFEAINHAHRVLIPIPIFPGGDSLSSSLAVFRFLKKLNKEPYLVCKGIIPDKFKFLPGLEDVTTDFDQSRGFVISVKTSFAPLEKLTYHINPAVEEVNIFLKPAAGHYGPQDVSFRSDKFPYDLIISLGTPSLDLYGKLHDDNTDLFFETPIINIDHHPNNEHFGEINLVDITATSTAEILSDLLENFEAGLIDEFIATNLLSGILVETNSFQHIKTTPKAFLNASSLISQGANQQEIIKHLYKTKTVSLLKLWGRALARLRLVPEFGLSLSVLKNEDVIKSGSNEAEVQAVMEEFVVSLSDSKIIVLFFEQGDATIKGLLFIHPSLASLGIEHLLGAQVAQGSILSFYFYNETLTSAEERLLAKLNGLKGKIV